MDIQLNEEQLASLTAHRIGMIAAGYDIVGTVPVLLPPPELRDAPAGIFQVWWLVGDQFVYINPEGEDIYVDFLPVSEDF